MRYRLLILLDRIAQWLEPNCRLMEIGASSQQVMSIEPDDDQFRVVVYELGKPFGHRLRSITSYISLARVKTHLDFWAGQMNRPEIRTRRIG